MRWVAIALCLVGCRSKGTITLDFDVDGASCAPFSADYWRDTGAGSAATCTGESIAISHYVLYAEPDTACSSCACGGCFGAAAGGVRICPDDTGAACTDIHGRELALSPGIWAVVLEAYAPGPPGGDACLVASECLDIVVDADGTTSRAAPLLPENCNACE